MVESSAVITSAVSISRRRSAICTQGDSRQAMQNDLSCDLRHRDVVIAMIFTVVSLVRSYTLRRMFESDSDTPEPLMRRWGSGTKGPRAAFLIWPCNRINLSLPSRKRRLSLTHNPTLTLRSPRRQIRKKIDRGGTRCRPGATSLAPSFFFHSGTTAVPTSIGPVSLHCCEYPAPTPRPWDFSFSGTWPPRRRASPWSSGKSRAVRFYKLRTCGNHFRELTKLIGPADN